MSAADTPPPLRIVLFREAQGWLAQGLEHDVGVQASNLKELMLRLGLALDRHAAHGELAALPPAPHYFQVLWPLGAGAFVPEAFATSAPVSARFTLVA
ncbi:MAG TPA: hypothetical protein VN222_11955 [Novosphingobium sp.]|nr:hypothetical protein [Novosphingobium sp.]